MRALMFQLPALLRASKNTTRPALSGWGWMPTKQASLCTFSALAFFITWPLGLGAQELLPTKGLTDRNGGFGTAVAVSGSHIVVGEPNDPRQGEGSGAVHLFEVGTYVRSFASPNPGPGFAFGTAVAVSDEYVLVGEPKAGAGQQASGLAHLFRWDGTYVRKLVEPTPTRDGWFGSSLALSKRYALIGAPGSNAAYLFDLGSTSQIAIRMQPSNVTGLRGLGLAVRLCGDRPLVSALIKTAFLFDVTGTVAALLKDPVRGVTSFGAAVACGADRFVVGAPTADISSTGETFGAAHVFDASGNVTAQLTLPQGQSEFALGRAVAVADDHIILTGNRGAFIFNPSGRLVVSLEPPAGAEDGFGRSADGSGDLVVVGAPDAGSEIEGGGAAVIYRIPKN